LNYIGYDTAGHVAGMPGKGYQPVGMERIGIVAVTATRAQKFTPDFTQATIKLTAVP